MLLLYTVNRRHFSVCLEVILRSGERQMKKERSLFTHVVNILDLFGDGDILNEEVVSTRNVLHDVPLDGLIVEDCEPVVDQNRWWCCLKICPGNR